MNHTESYIDNSIAIDEKLPTFITDMTDEMEDLDRTKPEFYFNRIDDFWIICKNCCVEGMISKHTWDLLTKKYITKAYRVSDKEDCEDGYL